jgi:glycosyltransferase involved in cell wall biosynthesis
MTEASAVGIGVSWLTNLPAAYRLPVWEHLATAVDLELLLLADVERFTASKANRGPGWLTAPARGYAMRELPTWQLSVGEDTYYVTRPFADAFGRTTSAIVLGGWESPSYFQAMGRAKRAGLKTIGFYESTLLSQAHQNGPIATARRRFFSRLDAVVVPGEAAEDAVKAMDLPDLAIFRGFNAVDVTGIHAKASAARRTSSATGRGHRYLYMGRLIPLKNLTAMLLAFAAAAEPEDSLTIAGGGVMEAELRAMQVPHVSFVGSVAYEAVPDLLAQHDTLVLASTNEVWGLVVNEALAAGLHAVVSDRCGVVPSVRHMDGVTVVPTTVEGIRDGLIESRRAWRGPIEWPEILAHGPKEFAGTFLDAITYVTSPRSSATR